MKEKAKELITRWQSPELQTFHLELKEWLVNGTFQGNSSPFGRIGERWDFRGYDFSQHRFVKHGYFENVDLALINFTHCRFEKSKFINTLFEKSTFYDFSEHDCVFDHCLFIKSSLRLSGLGHGGSKYMQTLFEKCQFRSISGIRAEFTQCKFLNNDLKGTQFGASSFEDCIFTGKVHDVWFNGGYVVPDGEQTFGKAKPNPMTVSFEDAELSWPVFRKGCDLSKVILPKKGNHYRFDRWQERLEHVASIVSTWTESEARKAVLQEVNDYLVFLFFRNNM